MYRYFFAIILLILASTDLDEAIIEDLDLFMNLDYVEEESMETYEELSDEEFKKAIESSKEDES